ncbi:hypothetical protein [Streptomyces sp. NPDC001020]
MPVTVASYEPPSDPGRMTTQQLGHLLFITTDAGPRRYTPDVRPTSRVGTAEMAWRS